MLIDTSSLTSVRKCAEEWKNAESEIDFLFHNAGIGADSEQAFSPDGLPTTYATNLLGSFVLTQILEPSLSNEARIIFSSSVSNYSSDFAPTFSLEAVRNRLEPGFHAPVTAFKADGTPDDVALYGHTKAMQIVFAKLLQSRWDLAAKVSGRKNERAAHAFSPGFTSTPALPRLRNMRIDGKLAFKILCVATALATDVSQGAATGVWLATTRDKAIAGEEVDGGYWERMTRRATMVDLMSREMLERFWIRWEADAGISWK